MFSFKKQKAKTPQRAFPSSVKKMVWYKQGEMCAGCGDLLDLRTVQYDHVIRYADGGDNLMSNCQALCPNCHAMKTFDDNRKK